MFDNLINVLFEVLDTNGIFSDDQGKRYVVLSDKLILLNKMVISSGNENNTHFSVTYETESIPEHGLGHRIVTFDTLKAWSPYKS